MCAHPLRYCQVCRVLTDLTVRCVYTRTCHSCNIIYIVHEYTVISQLTLNHCIQFNFCSLHYMELINFLLYHQCAGSIRIAPDSLARRAIYV